MDARVVVVLAYMAVLMWLGVYAGKYIKSFSDFLVGARMFGWWPIALTFAAAWTGGAAATSMIGSAYANGVSAVWWWMAIVIPYLLNGFFLAGQMRKTKAPTMASLLSARFDHRVSLVAAVTQTIGYVFLNCAQVVAGGLFLQTLLKIPSVWGTILTAVIIVFYTYMGGLIACTISDVLQQVVSMTTFLGALVFLLSKGGGISGLSALPSGMKSLSAGFNTKQFITWVLSFSLGHFGMQSTFMRVAQARTEKHARTGQIMGGVVLFTVAWLVVLVGMACRPFLGSDIPTASVATTMVMRLPAILGGLYAAGVLSAVMSTADNNLLASTGQFVKDIYAKYIDKSIGDQRQLALSRFLVIPSLAISVLFGLYMPDIVGWITKGMAMNGMISVAVLGGLYWKRATSEGAFASALGGMLTFLIWTFTGNPLSIDAVIPGALVALTLLVVVSLATKPKSEEEINRVWSGDYFADSQ